MHPLMPGMCRKIFWPHKMPASMPWHRGAPIAVHLMYPQFLDGSSLGDREVGLQMEIWILKDYDELWLCGGRISAGMQRELDTAV